MVIADWLTPTITKQNLSESQCKFRTNTVNKIFVLRQLQLECWEQNADLCAAFSDMTKVFDKVNQGSLWKILGKVVCPAKFLNVV